MGPAVVWAHCRPRTSFPIATAQETPKISNTLVSKIENEKNVLMAQTTTERRLGPFPSPHPVSHRYCMRNT